MHPHKTRAVNSGALEGEAAPVTLVTAVMLLLFKIR